MNASKNIDSVTEMMREKMKVLFPSIGKDLYVSVYSRKSQESKWDLESGSYSSSLKILAEYTINDGIPDSRIGAWGEPKQIKWTISITQTLNKKLNELKTSRKVGLDPVRYFFDMVLKKMSAGLIDCMMFELLENRDSKVVSHNSVANYVQVVGKKYEKTRVMGVIVSEDGGVDVKMPEVSEK